MSRTIDSRVVEMQFDNKQFERDVSTTMSTLDRLKHSLNLDGASKGLDSVNAAAKKVDMSGLSGAVETVRLKFSALEVMAVTALVNITNSAINIGKSLLKNTIGVITEGGKKRALAIEQAKFQFKGLGMDIEATMADASYAVDGTAYSLDAAAKVASQLGASGLRAGEDMRRSLRAVSGVAAMAGSSYEDIGNVFTKVAGQGRLMGDDLLRLSSRGINAAATIAKELNKTEAEVREMVTKGQISFKMFADSMDSAFGEHATAANETFTGSLSNVKSALGRIGEQIYTPLHKNMIEPLNSLRLLINKINEKLKPLFKNLESWFEVIGKKFNDFIIIFTKNIDVFKMGDETSDKLRRTFAGLFAVLDLLKQAIGFVFNVAGELFGLFGGPAAGDILGITASLGDFLVKLNRAVKEGNVFKRAFETLKDVFTTVAENITDAINRVKEAFGSFKSIDTRPIDEFSNKAEKSFKPFTRIAQIFGAAFEAIVKVLEWAAPIVAKLGSIIGKGLGALADKVSYSVEHMEFNEILDIINTGLFGAILLAIRNFIKSLTDITSDSGGFIKGLTGILDGVRGSLEAYQSSLKAKTLLTIASAIGILAAALVALSMIESEKLTTSLIGITGLFIELSAAMIVLGKAIGTKKMAKVSGTMIAMSIAILILSKAMKNLASLDWEGIAKGTVGIAALATVLVVAAKSLDKSSGKLIKGSIGLIAFATAILIMSKAVESMSALSWAELAKGLTVLTVILAEVVAITHLMGDSKRMISTGLGMIALGAAINIFASAIAKMGQLSWGEIARGLTTMTGALTAITVALNFMPKGMINKATGLVILGAAMKIFASAVAKMGQLSWEEIAKGVTAMAGALTAITVALNFMPKGMIGMGVGLITVGAALLIVSKALENMGGMSWDEVAKGLVALGGSLLIITVAMKAMTGGLAGAAAMLVMAVAIGTLTPSLKTLGEMDLAEIGKALLALVGVFVIIGAAGLILAPLTPVLLALAVAIALLGVAVLAIGGGLLMFSAGLTALAVAGTAGAASLVVVVTSLLSLIPLALEKLGEGVVAFARIISNGMPAIMEAVKQIALGLIQVLVEITPPVVEALLTFLITLLEQLANAVPKMMDAGMCLLLGILKGISAHIKDVVVVALNIISEFLRGIAEGIPGVISAGVDIIVAFLKAIGQETPRIIDAGFKMIIDFINGLADAIRENIPVLGDAMGNLAGAMIDGLIGGITAGVKNVVDSVKNLGKKALGGLKSLLGIHSPSKEFERLGMYTSEGFAKGVKGDQGNITSTVRDMSAKMLAVFNSSAPEFKQSGSTLMDNFIAGVRSQDAGSEIVKSAKNGLSNSIFKITDFINDDIDTQPTIRPVLDLSDVESGTGKLNALFSRTQAMSINTRMNRTSDLEIQNGEKLNRNGNTYQFTQNNYSPKPLSRLEIYRQTKNQFSAMKGLVET